MRAITLATAALLISTTSPTLASAPFTRYTVSSETGIVRDNMTGLFWEQEPAAGEVEWSEADAYCRALGRGGRNWRLPRIKELLTLIDPSTSGVLIDSTIFPNTAAASYWTFTQHVVATDNYWTVSFATGGTRNDSPGSRMHVRCVQ